MDTYNTNYEHVRREEKEVYLNAVSKNKIYLFFGVAVGFTALITYLFSLFLDYIGTSNNTFLATLALTSISLSGIAILIISLIFSLSIIVNKEKKGLIITLFSLYSLAMGILLSSIMYSISFEYAQEGKIIITSSIAITSGVFLISGLLGYTIKRINYIASFLSVSFFGIIGLILLNSLFGSNLISWLISIILFVYTFFVAIYDFYFIRRLTNGVDYVNTSLALYCAFKIYSDFVFILLRVLIIIASLYSRRR